VQDETVKGTKHRTAVFQQEYFKSEQKVFVVSKTKNGFQRPTMYFLIPLVTDFLGEISEFE